ncbi:MAG: hypothetical protein M0C28_22585 [Candidatus Moduliflexus flocculans]|nr:hypothetical protein [Candidatus Moduliflexus flocculans]
MHFKYWGISYLMKLSLLYKSPWRWIGRERITRKSVAGILVRLDRKDEMNVTQRIQMLEDIIHKNRAAKAETDRKLMAIRESETYNHSIVDETYKGTAAAIARRFKKKKIYFPGLKITLDMMKFYH